VWAYEGLKTGVCLHTVVGLQTGVCLQTGAGLQTSVFLCRLADSIGLVWA